MEKRQRHNLLLILAVVILLIGAIVQIYLMTAAERKPAAENPPETLSQPK